MKLIVDRFEEGFAVCEGEDQEMINVERSKLPEGVMEGDVLLLQDDDTYIIDHDERLEIEDRIKKLMDDLWE